MATNFTIMVMSLVIIYLLYNCINGHHFADPRKILGMGLLSILFSFLYKYVVAKFLPPSALDATPFIDMTTAALGGNLIASAMVIKAQKEHNRAKEEVEQSLVSSYQEVEYLRTTMAAIVAQEHSLPEHEYAKLMTDRVKAIMVLDAEIKKLEQERDNLKLL